MARYTSKYSGAEIDAKLDAVKASNLILLYSNSTGATKVTLLSTDLAKYKYLRVTVRWSHNDFSNPTSTVIVDTDYVQESAGQRFNFGFDNSSKYGGIVNFKVYWYNNELGLDSCIYHWAHETGGGYDATIKIIKIYGEE